MSNTFIQTLCPHDIDMSKLPRIAYERRDRYISSLGHGTDRYKCATLIEPLPNAFELALQEHPWLSKVYEILDSGMQYTDDDTLLIKPYRAAVSGAMEYMHSVARDFGVNVTYDGGREIAYTTNGKQEINLDPDESIYTQMDFFIHELIHADDDVRGGMDWHNVVDRARSESKAYAHSPRTWRGDLYDAFYYSLRGHMCTLGRNKGHSS